MNPRQTQAGDHNQVNYIYNILYYAAVVILYPFSLVDFVSSLRPV